MKIVKLKGGLGNQMFQYIFAKYIEKTCNEEVLLDFSVYEGRNDDEVRKPRIKEFNISLRSAEHNKIDEVCILSHRGDMLKKVYRLFIGIEALLNHKYCLQKATCPFFNKVFCPQKTTKNIDLNKIKKYRYFDGYWQSWRYVDAMKEVVRNEFIPNKSLSEVAEIQKNAIENKNAVFVGIRRGDYVNSKRNVKKYGTFDEKYYIEAMDIIAQRVKNPQFYIFSNDIEWVKKNMKFASYQVIYNEKTNEVSDLEELVIMSNCKHAVICNSTYYWWAAWMISNPQKVIVAPKKWFANGKEIEIVPDEWIKL